MKIIAVKESSFSAFTHALHLSQTNQQIMNKHFKFVVFLVSELTQYLWD